ncbi:MAG TPA: sugar transferase, partial [Myxococcota bacterium]|nr:sugar transferase [Myxococcota bacterium]
ILVKLESPGPAFYIQERLGKNEQPFGIIKLRTMRQDAEAGTGAVWSQGQGDPRVTRVGRFLRRSRIDELPQFYNVLRGDMSVIGPRPEREHFVRLLKEKIPFYGLRFSVKPGVTGWAQVRYRYGASEEDAVEKLSYELYAVQEMSPALYILILLKTIQTVMVRPGS